MLQILTAKINAYLKFAGNIIQVSETWRSGIKVGDIREVNGSNPCTAVFLQEIRWMRWKKIFHRKIQRNSYKNSPLSVHSTLKDAGALRRKKFFL